MEPEICCCLQGGFLSSFPTPSASHFLPPNLPGHIGSISKQVIKWRAGAIVCTSSISCHTSWPLILLSGSELRSRGPEPLPQQHQSPDPKPKPNEKGVFARGTPATPQQPSSLSFPVHLHPLPLGRAISQWEVPERPRLHFLRGSALRVQEKTMLLGRGACWDL